MSSIANCVRVLVQGWMFASFTVAGAFAMAAPRGDVVLDAHDITGLRGSLVLTFQAVKIGTEDRVVAHFDLNGVEPGFEAAVLRIPLANWDPEPPAGSLGVYWFYGDGVVSADEWDAGMLLREVAGIEAPVATLAVEVTSAVNEGLAQQQPYLSFVYRGGPSDRYFLGSIVNLPDSTILLDYVPEPASWAMAGVGILAVGICRRRRTR
ncbi:MAG: hypothetical protein DCC67_13080 [Planctomycetota bacterium]|nr:MAG: hypothetical protein DCC67_13080 [Planctomycetota bacterium]